MVYSQWDEVTLWVCTDLRLERLEEFLVVYSGHAADLLHLSLFFSVAVYEVCSDTDG